MKRFISLLSLLILTNSLMAQFDFIKVLSPDNLILESNNLNNNITTNSTVDNGELWINDTIISFRGNFDGDWVKEEIFTVLSRNICGKKTAAIKDRYDSDSLLQHYESYLYNYHDNGGIKSIVVLSWDKGLSEYKDTSEYEVFDENGNQIEYNSYTGFFHNRSISSYNENNQLLENSSFIKSIDTTGWTPFLHYNIEYNDFGNQISFISSTWSDVLNDWEEYGRFIYIYDVDNFLINIEGSVWDNEISEWIPHSHQDFVNDDKGNMIQRLYQIWDKDQERMINNNLYNFTYDGMNNNTSYTVKNWENDTIGWVNDAFYTYAYNDNKDVIESQDKEWNADSLKWVTIKITVSEFDDYYNKTKESNYHAPFYDKIIRKESKDEFIWRKMEVPEPVVIEKNPISIEVCEGEVVEFSINAKGENINYQWYVNGVELSGITGSAFTFDNVSLSDAGDYYCVVSGNCNSLTSEVATLSIINSALITSQPSSVNICEHETATFEIKTNGEVNYFQWTKDGVEIGGAKTAKLVIDNISITDSGVYLCVISGNCGTIKSKEANLEVNEKIDILTQPKSVSIIKGAEVKFTVNATGNIDTYQWYKDDELLNDGNKISGSNTSQLILSDVDIDEKGEYFVKLSGVCGELNSEKVTLSVTTAVLELENIGIFVSPNPANAIVNIQNLGDEIKSIKLYNDFGQLVFQKYRAFNSIDVSTLTEGVYFIEILKSDSVGVGKIIVKKQ